ncbi:DUF2235 domain-containing protein [Thiomonas sp.]|jgi:uncharacterized protein (DUF2235 family)|uniref:DUF2235 domain-containing protein n=1 Tax=Thiomonas sp. TaxID=2047785 RepID=UPI0026022F69|nr:DUF2235 domain-containing protein [Thiomonas sp.]
MKRIALFSDGTWSKPDQADGNAPTPTNVVKLSIAVAPQDAHGIEQIVFYQKGLGEQGGLWDKLSGGAFGLGISSNIRDLYLFVVQNYTPGDQLFLFGFSRGAYTVRSVAGLIRNCGILRPQHVTQLGAAYALYRDRTPDSHPNAARSVAFREAYSWPDAPIDMIGVWDTVGALGIPVTPLRFWSKPFYEFHDVTLSSHVRYAYQALAIDERRKPFVPTLWQTQPQASGQVVEQAWFPGVHGDVGGGQALTGLSDGALLWMADRAQRCGLALDTSLLPPHGDPAAPMGDSMTLFYRLLGSGERQPGLTNPGGHEGVHTSTLSRHATVPGYRPAALERFLAMRPVTYLP